jgi:hypothetical protein
MKITQKQPEGLALYAEYMPMQMSGHEDNVQSDRSDETIGTAEGSCIIAPNDWRDDFARSVVAALRRQVE